MKIAIARVFIGGGRRWLTLGAACRAHAQQVIKRRLRLEDWESGDEWPAERVYRLASRLEREHKRIHMTHKVTDPGPDDHTVTPEWVLASKYQELTGVTRETVKQRKKSGVWRDGQQVAVIARRMYVNIKNADKWINDQLPQRRQA